MEKSPRVPASGECAGAVLADVSAALGAAERVGLAQCAVERVEQSVDEVMRDTVKDYDTVKVRTCRIYTENGRATPVLLPVWLMTTVKEGKTYTFAVNGQTGKLTCDVPADKIDVIYQGCGSRFKLRESEKKLHETHTAYMLPERYIVSVGSIEERKNILLAVKAMRMVPDDVSLVVVGRSTPYCEKVKWYVRRNGLEGRVRFLHDVPADDLPAIYQMAEASVYPSRYEGFGLPVVEAIQSGLPVVACTGSCLEEAGGNATLYVAPDDVCGMAKAIRLTLKGAPGRDERIAEGMQYITRFENADVARKVLDVYDKLMNN